MNHKNRTFAYLTLSAFTAALVFGCGKKDSTDYSKYVTLGDYKNLTVERLAVDVTDEDVQAEIQNDLQFSAEYVDAGRPAENGDVVILDYTGTIDGAEFEGGSEVDAELELGSDSFIEGFEEQIVGMKAGEEKDITVTFPTPYDGVLDGEEAVFHISLKNVYEVQVPEYNDEFVSTISDYSTVEEYEAGKKEELIASYTEDSKMMACENALQLVVDSSTFDGYPEELFEESKTALESENQAFAEMLGLDDVSEFLGDDYNADELALDTVYQKMTVYTLAAKEGLKVTDEEYEEALAEELLYSDYESIEELKKNINETEQRYIILYQKVLDFLGETCTFVDIPAEDYYTEEDEEAFEEGEVVIEDDPDGDLIIEEDSGLEEEAETEENTAETSPAEDTAESAETESAETESE